MSRLTLSDLKVYMIRFFIGFMIVWGVAGGMDSMPDDASYSYMFWMFAAICAGFGIMVSGVNQVKGR